MHVNITQWLVIQGDAMFIDGQISYPEPDPKSESSKDQPIVKLKAAEFFEDGTLSISVKTSLSDTRVYWELQSADGAVIMIGLNPYGHTYGILRRASPNWKPLDAVRDVSIPHTDAIKLMVKVRGSSVNLYVNSVQVCSASVELTKAQPVLVVQSGDAVSIDQVVIENARPIMFVVMQFTPVYDALYKEVIKPVGEAFGYSVIRGDDVYTNTPIIKDIVDAISSASLVVADITPDNPNVYYEVGYAHALSKNVVLMCNKSGRTKLPFDVSGFRTLYYEDSIAGKSRVEELLTNHLKAISEI